MTHGQQCPTCLQTFESKRPKRYCKLACYVASPEFRARMAANMASGREKGRGPARQGTTQACAHCGAQMYLTATDAKRNKKTCSRLCYRQFMAARFDRHIGAVESIEQLSNYDEFLAQEILPCLVNGCTWRGHDLSLHMNLAHGVEKEAFKRAAGFNLTTGVVSATMLENLQARGNLGGRVDNAQAIAARRFDYVSRESLEHRRKAAALRTLENVNEPTLNA